MAKYNEKQVARMVEVYSPDADEDTRKKQVQQLADEMTKELKEPISTRSIVAKLSSGAVNVYKKPTAKTKTGGEIVKKNDVLAEIVKMVNDEVGDDFASVADISTAGKMNKAHLATLAGWFSTILNNAEDSEPEISAYKVKG